MPRTIAGVTLRACQLTGDRSMQSSGRITREIFAKAKAGDVEAYDRFFQHHSARILVYINYNLSRRLRRKIDPADILQELYLKLLLDFEGFCGRAEKRGIHRALIRMADHEITEAYRYYFKTAKRDARREVAAEYLNATGSAAVDPLAWVPADATSVSASVAQHEEYQRVMAMLMELDPLEQYVTVARIIEEIPTQEIAERLGKSRGAVHMMIARARDKIRRRAEDSG